MHSLFCLLLENLVRESDLPFNSMREAEKAGQLSKPHKICLLNQRNQNWTVYLPNFRTLFREILKIYWLQVVYTNFVRLLERCRGVDHYIDNQRRIEDATKPQDSSLFLEISSRRVLKVAGLCCYNMFIQLGFDIQLTYSDKNE